MGVPARGFEPETLLQHAAFLRGIARGLLVDVDSAEDIVQDTYLTAMRHPPRGGNLRAWLAVVARNLAFRTLRSRTRRATHEARAASSDTLPSAAELAARRELQRRVLAAVESLHEPYRATLHYRYFDGLTPLEISKRLGIPVKTIKARLYRALRALRMDLDRQYGGQDGRWCALLLAMVPPVATPPVAGGAVLGNFGGIALVMKKWAALLVFVLCLLGTVAVVWESAPGSGGDFGHVSPSRGSDASPLVAHPPEPQANAPTASERAPVLHEDDPVPAHTFAGRVVDPEGHGIGWATLHLIYWMPGSDEVADSFDKVIRRERERREQPATTTDEAGYFRFDRPYPSRSHLVVHAAEFSPTVTAACEPGAFHLIRMTRTERLGVTVVRDDGRHVPDAVVRLVTPPFDFRTVLAEAACDEAGVAQLPLPQTSRLRVQVAPKDPALSTAEARVMPGEGAIEVRLPARPVRTCRIVDALTAAPVPGAWVMTCRGHGLSIYECRKFFADSAGEVQVPWGTDLLRYATAPGYEVAPVSTPETRLLPAMRIEGTVVDGEGQPVPDAAIVLAQPPVLLFGRRYLGMEAVAAWSDHEGRFALDDVTVRQGPPGAAVRSVIATHPDYPSAVVDGVHVEPGRRASVLLRFPASATIEVEIVDPAGAPVPDQWVLLSRRLAPPIGHDVDGRNAGLNLLSLQDGQHTMVTDADGIATATRLPPGVYVATAEGSSAEQEVAEGSRTRIRIVRGAGPSISGRVLRADGSPAASVWVGLPGAPSHMAKRTDAEGRFRFVDLPDFRLADIPHGPYSVQVTMGEWHGVYEVPAHLGEDLSITLPSGPARLHVTLVDLPPDTRVQYALATDVGGRLPRSRGWVYISETAFETAEFTPGHGVILLRVKGHGEAVLFFDAPAGRETAIDAVLRRGGSVHGTVAPTAEGKRYLVKLTRIVAEESRDGDLLRGLLRLHRESDLMRSVPADGSFGLDDVPAGTYRITLLADGNRELAAEDLEVPAGEDVPVSFHVG